MGLSDKDRDALRARAAGLRAEVSALRSERDLAVEEASQVQQDLALMGEVARLEQEAEAARIARDRANGSVEDAIAIMNAVADVQPVTDEADVTEEEVDEEVVVTDDELIVTDEATDAPVDGTEGDK